MVPELLLELKASAQPTPQTENQLQDIPCKNIFNLIFWLSLQYLVQDCMKKHTLISNWTQSAWVTFFVKPQFPIKPQNNFGLKPSTRQEHCQKLAVKHFHKKLTNSISWNCLQYFVQNSRAESANDAKTD